MNSRLRVWLAVVLVSVGLAQAQSPVGSPDTERPAAKSLEGPLAAEPAQEEAPADGESDSGRRRDAAGAAGGFGASAGPARPDMPGATPPALPRPLENAHILSVTVEEQFAPNVKESLRDLYAGEISAGQLTIASDARTIHIRAADDELLNQIQSIIRDWEDQAKERRVVGESVEAEEAAKQRQQLEELQRLAADQLQSDAPTPSSNAALQPGAGLGLSPAKSLETDSRVFLLKYIPAADAEQLVSLVLPVAVRADQRTNSLVVAGSAEKLEAVERLLESLDAPAPPTPAVVEAAQRAQAQKHLEDARREVTNRALQWLEQTQRPDAAAGAERDERLKELHDAVAEEFRLRQQQQELEVQALEARLQSLRRVIQYREQIREEVIRRRVEELLDPLADGGADGRDQIGAGPRAAAVVQ